MNSAEEQPNKMVLPLAHAHELFGILNALVEECRMDISKDGWSVSTADPANVDAVYLTVPPEAFSHWRYEGEQKQIGLAVGAIYEALDVFDRRYNLLKSTDEDIVIPEAEFSFKWSDTGYVGNPTQPVCTCTLKVGFITKEIEMHNPHSLRKEPKIPALNLPATVQVRTDDLKLALKCIEREAEYAKFGVETQGEANTVYLSAHSAEQVKQNTKAELFGSVSISKSTQEIHSFHSLDYLNDLVKAIRSTHVTLQLGVDYPVIFLFTACDGKAQCQYMLAPRVESE